MKSEEISGGEQAVSTPQTVRAELGTGEPRLLEQVRRRIRLKHYSLRTERAYLYWIRRFIYATGKRHPKELGTTAVEGFLSSLATVDKVAPSTQSQALAAVLFLYKEVLGIKLEWMDNVVRAKPRRHLPIVLTTVEVSKLLACLRGREWLQAASSTAPACD